MFLLVAACLCQWAFLTHSMCERAVYDMLNPWVGGQRPTRT